ncbi:hypothetical protein AAMO2058_000862600 [Amorphochlora amoebiformis]
MQVEELQEKLLNTKERLEEARETLQLKDSIIKTLAPQAMERHQKIEALREKLGLYKAQLAYAKYYKLSKSGKKDIRKPIMPVVDMQLGSKNLPNLGSTLSQSLVFRVSQNSRPTEAYKSEMKEMKGEQNPEWKRCQISSAKINFSEPIRFDVLEVSTGIPDFIGGCELTILDLLLMAGDHEVPLKLKGSSTVPVSPARTPKKQGDPNRNPRRGSRRRSEILKERNGILQPKGSDSKSNKLPSLVFRHFAVSGNHQANFRLRSSSAASCNDEKSKEYKGKQREDISENALERTPTDKLTLEEQVEREELEQRQRREQRIAVMRALLGGSKVYNLFEKVVVRGKGKGTVVSKLIQAGPNTGKHRIELDNTKKELYAAPEELEALPET